MGRYQNLSEDEFERLQKEVDRLHQRIDNLSRFPSVPILSSNDLPQERITGLVWIQGNDLHYQAPSGDYLVNGTLF